MTNAPHQRDNPQHAAPCPSVVRGNARQWPLGPHRHRSEAKVRDQSEVGKLPPLAGRQL